MDEKAGPEITLSEKILNQIIDRQEKFFKSVYLFQKLVSKK